MTATTGEAWIIDGVRSPRGKGKSNGSLHHIHPQELLAQTLKALAARTNLDTRDVDDVIIGNGNPAGDHGSCIGRMAVLAADGVGDEADRCRAKYAPRRYCTCFNR